jgi:DNA-binding response OmpR family regulator
MSEQTLHILLIEDDVDDIELLQEAFANNGIAFTMDVLKEGDKIAWYIENYSTVPSLIVMDLNLPKASGREIMKMVKDSATFKIVPLIVFSTSSAKDDILYSYSMGASKFITKPATLEGWNSTVLTWPNWLRGIESVSFSCVA